MAHDVFISYASEDKPTGDAACAVLEAKGLRCWIAPRDILPGQDCGEAIVDAIEGAKVFVLVFSSHANTSQQIKREVERAVNRGLPIIPLRIENVAPTKSLEYYISTPHWLDAFSPPLERHLDYLADVIARLMGGPEAPPPGPGPIPAPPPPAPAPALLARLRRMGPWELLAFGVVVLVAGFLLREAWTGGDQAAPPPAPNAPPTAPAPPAAASPSPGEPQGNWAQCSELPTVAGCTAIIDGGQEMPENLAIAFVRRAIAWRKAGDLDKAIADDSQAIKLRPGFAIAFVNRGNAWSDKGEAARAVADYTDAIRLQGDLAPAFVGRCRTRAQANVELTQAAADCERAVRLDPDSAQALDARGLVGFRQGRFAAAAADETAALAIDPQRAPSLYLRGLARRQSGDVAGGLADLRAATALAPAVADQFTRYGIGT